jgi:hypothetical protein
VLAVAIQRNPVLALPTQHPTTKTRFPFHLTLTKPRIAKIYDFEAQVTITNGTAETVHGAGHYHRVRLPRDGQIFFGLLARRVRDHVLDRVDVIAIKEMLLKVSPYQLLPLAFVHRCEGFRSHGRDESRR